MADQQNKEQLVDGVDLNSSDEETDFNGQQVPFNPAELLSGISQDITGDDLNQAMGLAQNAFGMLQQNPEQINNLFGAMLQGMMNNQNPEEVMASVVQAPDSPFAQIKDFVQDRKISLSSLIQTVQNGRIEEAFESLQNINGSEIKDSEITATVRELIKIPQKNSAVYKLINSVVNLSSSLNSDWLLEMYFETGDQDGVFTCVSNGATIEALSDVIDSGESLIAEMKERLARYQTIIAQLKLEKHRKTQITNDVD